MQQLCLKAWTVEFLLLLLIFKCVEGTYELHGLTSQHNISST